MAGFAVQHYHNVLNANGILLIKLLSVETGRFLNDNKLSGSLPSAWAAMHYLQVLQLQQNRIGGTLPPSWGQNGMASLYSM